MSPFAVIAGPVLKPGVGTLFLENLIIELLPGTLSGGGYPFFLENWIIELLRGSNLGWWCPFFRKPENTGNTACGYYPGS